MLPYANKVKYFKCYFVENVAVEFISVFLLFLKVTLNSILYK